MSPGWRAIEFALLSGFVVAVTLAVLAALLQRPICRALAAQSPTSRVRIARGLLLAPLLVCFAYAVITLLVAKLGATSASISAACSVHHGSWLHACLGHPIALGAQSWLWIALVMLLLVCTALSLRAARVLLQARRQLWALIRLGRWHDRHGQVRVLDTEAPLAVACDVGGGHVLLSRWLLEALGPLQLQVVLAHERAHLANRDLRWRLLSRVASGLHFPGLRRRLLDTLDLACEQRCDEAAADHVGSRLLVAETLLTVERLYRDRLPMPNPVLAMPFGTEFLRERVEALLDRHHSQASPLGAVLAVLALVVVLASTGWVHNFSEFLVTLLVI